MLSRPAVTAMLSTLIEEARDSLANAEASINEFELGDDGGMFEALEEMQRVQAMALACEAICNLPTP